MNEPTPQQCSDNSFIYEDGEPVGIALWYPQMGGYVGKCVVLVSEVPKGDTPCFDAYIWHDGEFPFSEESHPGKSPRIVHHCDAEQFINFGTKVKAFAQALQIHKESLDTSTPR